RPARKGALRRALAAVREGPRARFTARWLVRLGLASALAYAALVGVREAHEYATSSARFEVKSLLFEPTPHVPAERLVEL
ncbi:MAG: hypothetical protein KC636_29825, partial [Myxococcales bacterium]|nr:hypothetical protein [Myxococcales bacterium]